MATTKAAAARTPVAWSNDGEDEFTGLSAFPLTPFKDDAVDERAFVRLVERLTAAEIDSITALGSTGSYAFLDSEERARVARLAVEHAGTTPVFVGVGALCTSQAIGGTLPDPALTITHAAQQRRAEDALAESDRLTPLWSLFSEVGGSLRVVAAIAEQLGLASHRCLPLPIQGLGDADRIRVAEIVDELCLG